MSVNQDVLSIVFDWAGNWNSAIPLVSKHWRTTFYDINVPTLWQDLLKKATPELLRKMEMVAECNSEHAKPIKLVQDLSALLKEIAPPKESPLLAQSGRLNNFFNGLFGGKERYAGLLEAPAPVEYPARGLVPSFLSGQKAADNYNRGRARIDNLGFFKWDRPTEFPLAALKDLRAHPQLKDQPPNDYCKYLEIVARGDLLYFPDELMENNDLMRFKFSANLWEKMPRKLQRYIDKQDDCGNIKRMNFQSKILILSNYSHVPLFQYDRPYEAQSPLGKLFRSAYEDRPLEEVHALIDALSLNDQRDVRLSLQIIRWRPSWEPAKDSISISSDICFAVFRRVRVLYIELRFREEHNLRLCGILFRLAGMEPIQDRLDPRWEYWHEIAYANTARLADALMELSRDN